MFYWEYSMFISTAFAAVLAVALVAGPWFTRRAKGAAAK